MSKQYRIESKAGVVFGVYDGDTAEQAFAAMVADGGGEVGDAQVGNAADWIVEEVIYTFSRRVAAYTMSRNSYVYIPDQVAEAQREFDGRTFPVLRRDGSKTRATLRGDEYGLHTSGTGDPVVALS